MLRIISQDGTLSVPYEYGYVYMEHPFTIATITGSQKIKAYSDKWSIWFAGHKLDTDIGAYSSEGKARCVLTMMDKAWADSEDGNFVFRLPQDNAIADKSCETCKWGKVLGYRKTTNEWFCDCFNQDSEHYQNTGYKDSEFHCEKWEELNE